MSAHGLVLSQRVVRGICDGHPGCPKSGTANQQNNTNSNSSAERAQQVLKAIGAIGAVMEQSARQQAEREQRDEAWRQQEEWNRQQQERTRQQQEQALQQQEQALQQQIDQQVQAAIERVQQDPSLNPFGKAPAGADSPSAGNDSPSPADPSADLAGQACRWLVVRDEESCSSRSCYYTEGQTIAFGPRGYRCDQGRWTTLRDCTQAISELRKGECQRDILTLYGSPGQKETPAQRIYEK